MLNLLRNPFHRASGIRIGIVGCGMMGRRQARMFRGIAGCALVAVADVAFDRAVKLAEAHAGARPYPSLTRMLEEEELDAVSVVTPDAQHVQLALEAIAKGKHVLCEKPLCRSSEEARLLVDAARKAGVINMVNFSYRSAPAIQKARELVEQGEIGEIIHVEASYLQSWLSDEAPGWRSDETSLWRLSSRHGSTGAIGDVGGHLLDFVSYPVGSIKALSCRVQSFGDLKGESIGEYILDATDSAILNVEFGNGALGVIHLTRWASGYPNSLRLRMFGTLGSIVVDLDVSNHELSLFRGASGRSARWRKVHCQRTPTNYERFIRSIESGVNDQPDFARGAEIQKLIRCCEISHSEGARLVVES